MAITVTSLGQANDTTSGHTTTVLTTSAASAAGNTIVVCAYQQTNGGAGGASGVTDSAGNTYTKHPTAASTGSAGGDIWSCENASALGSGGTITATWNNANMFTGCVDACTLSGVLTASAFDKSAQANGSSTTPSSGATATLTQAVEVAIGFGFSTGGTPTFTEDATFTRLGSMNVMGADAAAFAYKVVAATTAITYAPTLSPSRPWGCLIATFKGQTNVAYTLTAAAGTFTLTGVASALNYGRKVAAAAGAFTLSGQAVTFVRSIHLAAAVGTFVLSGQTAILKKTLHMTAGAGIFALTGFAAILRKSQNLIAGAGSFVLTGNSVYLTKIPGMGVLIRKAAFVLQKLRVTDPSLGD